MSGRSTLALALLCVTACLEKDPDFERDETSGPTATNATTETSSGTADGGSTTNSSDGSTGTSGTATDSADASDSTDTADGSTGSETGPACEPPQEQCAGECTDTSTDKQNCGACLNKCKPAQEQCVDGMCVPK